MKPLICLLTASIFYSATYSVQPPKTPQTLISGPGWAYTVPFPVKNTQDIEKLIECESQGVNIARPDSNHKISWGVGQFNGTTTWAEFSKASGIVGSPMIPADAIRMMDWAISNGYIGRWTCAHILHLVS